MQERHSRRCCTPHARRSSKGVKNYWAEGKSETESWLSTVTRPSTVSQRSPCMARRNLQGECCELRVRHGRRPTVVSVPAPTLMIGAGPRREDRRGESTIGEQLWALSTACHGHGTRTRSATGSSKLQALPWSITENVRRPEWTIF